MEIKLWSCSILKAHFRNVYNTILAHVLAIPNKKLFLRWTILTFERETETITKRKSGCGETDLKKMFVKQNFFAPGCLDQRRKSGGKKAFLKFAKIVFSMN